MGSCCACNPRKHRMQPAHCSSRTTSPKTSHTPATSPNRARSAHDTCMGRRASRAKRGERGGRTKEYSSRYVDNPLEKKLDRTNATPHPQRNVEQKGCARHVKTRGSQKGQTWKPFFSTLHGGSGAETTCSGKHADVNGICCTVTRLMLSRFFSRGLAICHHKLCQKSNTLQSGMPMRMGMSRMSAASLASLRSARSAARAHVQNKVCLEAVLEDRICASNQTHARCHFEGVWVQRWHCLLPGQRRFVWRRADRTDTLYKTLGALGCQTWTSSCTYAGVSAFLTKTRDLRDPARDLLEKRG